MSYSVYLQGFQGGHAAKGGGKEARSLVGAYQVAMEPEFNYVRIEVGDGGAGIFASGDSMKVDRSCGTAVWDFLVELAIAVNWTIILIDGPACLTNEGQRRELPEELREEAVLIRSGEEFLAVMKA